MTIQSAKHIGRRLLVLDCLLVFISYFLAFEARHILIPDVSASLTQHLAYLPLVIPTFIVAMVYAGSYRNFRQPLFVHSWNVISAIAFTMGVTLVAVFMAKAEFYSRAFAYLFIFTTAVLVIGGRSFLVWYYFRGTNMHRALCHRVLIIGVGSRAKKAVELLNEHSEWGVEVVGYIDDEEHRRSLDESDVLLGGLSDIESVLEKNVVDEVIIAVPRSHLGSLGNVFEVCEAEGVRLKLMSDIFDFDAARIQLDIMGGKPLLVFEPVAHDELALLAKRVFDVLVTLAAMPVLLVIMAIAALAVRLDSPGPVFFVQQRVGLRKRTFPMLKFRSMYVDAEERLKDIEHLNEAEGPIFKIKDDPRVTRVGKFIRRTSIDELPQLINVLLGHMSLVGPRPMSLRDVSLFDQSIQRKRFSVRPGLTCLWQISGRSNLPFEKWLELDLRYINNWSLVLDLEILVKTVPALLFARGAV